MRWRWSQANVLLSKCHLSMFIFGDGDASVRHWYPVSRGTSLCTQQLIQATICTHSDHAAGALSAAGGHVTVTVTVCLPDETTVSLMSRRIRIPDQRAARWCRQELQLFPMGTIWLSHILQSQLALVFVYNLQSLLIVFNSIVVVNSKHLWFGPLI